MSEFLPINVREELARALAARRRKRSAHCVHVGDEVVAIFDLSETGFAVEAQARPRLRGLIDIHEGPRHLCRALIVASERDGDVIRYVFKRNTAAQTVPPVDFELPRPRPAGLLPSG